LTRTRRRREIDAQAVYGARVIADKGIVTRIDRWTSVGASICGRRTQTIVVGVLEERGSGAESPGVIVITRLSRVVRVSVAKGRVNQKGRQELRAQEKETKRGRYARASCDRHIVILVVDIQPSRIRRIGVEDRA
jgi:hypothetical protein